MNFQSHFNHYFHIPENKTFTLVSVAQVFNFIKLKFPLELKCIKNWFVENIGGIIFLWLRLNNTRSHTMGQCELRGRVTYSHGVSWVSEVREGTERRQRRLRDGHRARWCGDDSWRHHHSSFLLVRLVFFSLLHHCLQPRSTKSPGYWSPVAELTGRRLCRSQLPPLVHRTPAICPSSRLSISVSCEYDFKSLSFT